LTGFGSAFGIDNLHPCFKPMLHSLCKVLLARRASSLSRRCCLWAWCSQQAARRVSVYASCCGGLAYLAITLVTPSGLALRVRAHTLAADLPSGLRRLPEHRRRERPSSTSITGATISWSRGCSGARWRPRPACAQAPLRARARGR